MSESYNDEELSKRLDLLQNIEKDRNSKAILYVTGDRQGLETRIGQDVVDLFVDHLDALGPVDKISLVLYTSGGNTSAAWNLVNLLHMFCDDFEVIVPGKCMSAGTLISLGAKRIVMTKQATLGPIDPTIQHPLGPSIHGAHEEARAGVSVEAVNGYLDAIRTCSENKELEGKALLDLSNKVHPLVLGQIFRSRQQIRDLAQRLLEKNICKDNDGKIKRIIDFLCSESGSHDYTINRREADQLGLNIEKCSEELYKILRELRKSYTNQLHLQIPHDPGNLVTTGETAPYTLVRAIIESKGFGAHHFISKGEVTKIYCADPSQPDNIAFRHLVIRDQQIFEGWQKLT